MGDPPAAPALPPAPPASTVTSLNSINPSASIKLKLREALQTFETQHLKFAGKSRDLIPPATGVYFLYGTLRDPVLLAEILRLDHTPLLQPAYIVGYHKKRWGQYPALVDGEADQVVEGAAFVVPDERAALRLAEYETNNYLADMCIVHVRNQDGTEEQIEGFTFKFCGDEGDLTEGDFDLESWLRQVRRK